MRAAGAALLYLLVAVLSVPFALVFGLGVYNLIGTGFYGRDLAVATLSFAVSGVIAGVMYALHRAAQKLTRRRSQTWKDAPTPRQRPWR